MSSNEQFTEEERAILSRFFTELDGPVFALINMPEVVKGALFARYSRSPKSLRRLFLDEFVADPDGDLVGSTADDALLDHKRAERLYQTVFHEYGDDSVAQLGGVHLACEDASNLLTKVLEWGRLANYLEQSTRYVAYDGKVGGRYRYHIPRELEGGLAQRYVAFCDRTFATYSDVVTQLIARFEERFPKPEGDPTWVWRSTIKARAFDLTRGLLPAGTRSNVGIYATGQAYEMALMRMRAHPLEEARSYGDLMLTELRKVIPSFLTRVDRPDRGVRWSEYLTDVRSRLDEAASGLGSTTATGPSVTLTDFDEDAENEVIAAALYPYSEKTDDELLRLVSAMDSEERERIFSALVGDRANRRHKPGRAMERPHYRFDIVCDFGAFRDLQRHRLLTIDWQRLSTRLGSTTPDGLIEEGFADEWETVMDQANHLYEEIRTESGPDVAQYVVPLGGNIRFVMEMNAREAFHLTELRSQPAGHPSYRWVATEMHRLIREKAGHRLIADAMKYVDYTDVEWGRLEGERRSEKRRSQGSANTARKV